MATKVKQLRNCGDTWRLQKEAEDLETLEALNRTWRETGFGEEAVLFDDPCISDSERDEGD